MEQRQPQFDRFSGKPCISEEYPLQADKIFNLLEVDPKEDPNLRILDQREEDDLILVHYLEPTPTTQHIRGVIIDVVRGKIVAESFPHTEEYLASSKEALTVPVGESKGPDPTRCEVTKAHEGTILRVFRGANSKKWYMSTHRKIDGRRSRWSGPSFGEMFDEIWGVPYEWDEYLKPDACYIFLLSHGANRLVCEIPTPRIYHVQTFVSKTDGQMVATNYPLEKKHPGVENQTRLDISSTEDLIQQAKNLDWKECSGLLVTQYSLTGEITGCWKLVPESYHFRRNIRGNEPNFRFRYLQLKSDGSEAKIRELFPEKKDLFDQVEKDLKELPKFLVEYFVERYVRKNFIYLPREIHQVLENAKRNPDPTKPVEENISFYIAKSDARQRNAMIRFMLQEKKTTE